MSLPVSEAWVVYVPLIFIYDVVKWENPSHLIWYLNGTDLQWSVLSESIKGGYLTPLQMKIKGTQTKLHLQLSSLNFSIPSQFICLGLIETLKSHIQTSYIIYTKNFVQKLYKKYTKLIQNTKSVYIFIQRFCKSKFCMIMNVQKMYMKFMHI